MIALILIFGVDNHQSISFVFTERINNSGFAEGKYWFYVLPLGFLLTQYTITGYDACAHLSEETRAASTAAAKGLWKAIFYSAVGGWILLLLFTFAATHVDFINNVNGDNPYGAGYVVGIFASSLGLAAFKTVMIIATIGQFFCAGSGMTSASRMTFAFSRDRAIPGHQIWSKVTKSHAPVNATLLVAVLCLIVALPALKGNDANIPFAFYALTQITVIGLYIAYAIPIYLRWRMGDSFVAGPWTLGNKYKWMCPIAVLEVIIVCIYFSLPFSPLGIPGQRRLRARQRRGQLRADPGVRRDHRDRHLVVRLGQELVHRSRDPERLGRGGGAELAHATEGAGRPAPSAPRGA